MKRLCLPLALLCLPMLVSAQDAPAPRTLELHLCALSRGYMRPMRATAERLGKLPGFSDVRALGFSGDMLRLRVTTGLDDDAIAAALGLQKMGAKEGRLTMAADASQPRARRAEARAVMLEVARAIMALPRPQWGNKSKPVFENAHKLAEKLKLLGLDPAIADGVLYKTADYKIEEDGAEWGGALTYRIWVGKEWQRSRGVVLGNDWGFWNSSDDENVKTPDQTPPDYVGLQILRSPWSEAAAWVDTEGAALGGAAGDRSQTGSDGKLIVQEGAQWMRQVLGYAAAKRLRKSRPAITDLPAGRGQEIPGLLEAHDLWRWGEVYSINCLELSWRLREADKHILACLSAYHKGHAFYLEAEVDADAVYAAAKVRGDDLESIKKVEVGEALTWVVGPESGPEVFTQRRREAAAAMDAIFAAFAKLTPEWQEKFPWGPNWARDAGFDWGEIDFTHFKREDYIVHRQAMGDIEISVGTPMTGGRSWLLGNLKTAKVIRRDG